MWDLRALFRQLGQIIQARPILTLLFAIGLVGVAITGAAQIESVTGNEAFVGSNPTLDTYKKTFDQGSMATLVRGDVSEPATMRAIDRYDSRLSQTENVEQVISPADRVRREYGRIPDSQGKIRAVVGTSDSTIVTTVLSTDLSQQETRPVYTRATEARDWAQFPSDVEVTITGQPAFSAQLSALIQQSTQQLLGLAVGLMIIALFFLFRGVRLRLLPIVAVFTGVIWTFGAMGYTGVPNSTLTSAVFPILIGLGIDYSVQFHERYEEELNGAPTKEALPKALGGIGPPVLIAVIAAALGFGATWFSTLGTPAFVWFAQTSIFGVLLTFVAAILILLPLLTLYTRWRTPDEAVSDTPPSPGTNDQQTHDAESTASADIGTMGPILGRISRVMASHPFAVLGIALVLTTGGFYAGSDLDTVADTEDFIPQDLPALTDLQQFRSETGGGSSVQYSVLVSGDQLQDPETLRWMERYRAVAVGKPLITGMETPATTIKEYNHGTLPKTEAGVDQTLDRIPAGEKQRFYNDGYAHITVIGAQNMNTQEQLDLLDNVEKSTTLSQPPAGVEAELTGQAAAATPAIISQIEQRNFTTGLGVVLVFVALLLYYRNLLRAAAPLVPMLFVIGWQNLYMAALSIPVSPLGASLGAMTVGIGAEYTIIVMERYFEEVKQAGISRLDAVETAGARVGKAISVSGLTTIFGFSALTLSPFPMLADFGFLTVGVIFLTLVAAIATLPPTLIVFGRLADAIAELRSADSAQSQVIDQ
ncbi:efflux RND transporter permease subunit [Halorientalis pallida]|uniref:RND family transporter n=1 Tax=Halorientalis pallida TaxID=2479928 RepID=A0A498KVS7_9EURY|nr:RND family transporter [Halorientalis pallida]RXK48699.1 RND family transporter [Halorientalis pallida]